MSTEMTPHQESEKDLHVTIPYFLYEAMARSYYGQERNQDLPVEDPKPKDTTLNLSHIQFNPSDVPPTWRPGGTAARKQINVSPEIQSAEEEA